MSKLYTTKPTSSARKRLLRWQEMICQNPDNYTREALKADLARNGYDITTMIHDAARTLGMRDIISYDQRHAMGLLQFINRILEETI